MSARPALSAWTAAAALSSLGLVISVGYPVAQRLMLHGRLAPAAVPFGESLAQRIAGEAPQFVVWSDDGRKMIVSTVPQSFDIWTMLWRMAARERLRGRPFLRERSWLATQEHRKWLLQRLPDDIVVTAFSPDGRECAGRRAGQPGGGVPVRLNLETFAVSEISGTANSFPQSYSPDGRKLLITTRGRQGYPEVLDVASGRRDRSTRRASYAFWSDSGQIEAVELRGPRGSSQLISSWVADANLRIVRTNAHDIRLGDLLRLGRGGDGRIIACCRPDMGPDADVKLIAIDPATGRVERLGHALHGDVRTARIGRENIYLGRGPMPNVIRSIESCSFASGGAELLAKFPQGEFTACRWFNVSPSGDWLVFEAALRGQTSSSLYVAPVSASPAAN